MNKVGGFGNTYAIISSVHFRADKMRLVFKDGRELILPLKSFPEIAGLSSSQRRKHKLLAGLGLMFDDLDTVFHVSDFIGKCDMEFISRSQPGQSQLSKVAEPRARYKRK